MIEGFALSLSAISSTYGRDLCPKGFLGLGYFDVVTMLLSLVPSHFNLLFILLGLLLGFFNLLF